MFCLSDLLYAQRHKSQPFQIFQHLPVALLSGQAGEFIKTCQKSPLFPLCQRHPCFVLHNKHRFFFRFSRLLRRFFRVFHHASLTICTAEPPQRALFTFRLSVRQTDHGAKLHHRLIKISGPMIRYHKVKFLLHRFFYLRIQNIPPVQHDPGEYPQHIPVHRRRLFSVGNRGYRSCRITADPRQLTEFFKLRRHFPVVFLHDLLCRLLQIPHSVIIAEPLPEFQKPLFLRLRQSLYIRQCF